MKSVVMDTGFLTIHERGRRWPWARINLYKVPNAAVLVALARERTNPRENSFDVAEVLGGRNVSGNPSVAL